MNEKDKIYKTFDEWKAEGFCIIKGSKSTKRSGQNIPLFSQDQVTRNKFPIKSYDQRYDNDQDPLDDPTYYY